MKGKSPNRFKSVKVKTDSWNDLEIIRLKMLQKNKQSITKSGLLEIIIANFKMIAGNKFNGN